MSETTREFDIEIDKNLTLRKLLTTVAHEIVHVKQYARKELTEDSTWQGKTYNPKNNFLPNFYHWGFNVGRESKKLYVKIVEN